jgi:hypothetical protein
MIVISAIDGGFGLPGSDIVFSQGARPTIEMLECTDKRHRFTTNVLQ